MSDLIPADANFIAASDLNANGYLDFIDNDNDGVSDEEFVWQYTEEEREEGSLSQYIFLAGWHCFFFFQPIL